MKIEIDVAEFAAQLKAGKGIGGKDGALTPLIKQLTEMALQAELETHLSQDLEKNRKNGTTFSRYDGFRRNGYTTLL